MSDGMNQYEEQRERIAGIAMQIVIHAGDARNYIMEALDDTAEGRHQEAEEKLKKAKDELHEAHIAQTEVVQSEAAGTKYEYSLLFTHAQDTVMTICSEMNVAKKMITLYKNLEERIRKLEGTR